MDTMPQAARVHHQGPKNRFDGLQVFDFGIAENDYEWKTKGAPRLLYNINEKERFEILKVNQ